MAKKKKVTKKSGVPAKVENTAVATHDYGDMGGEGFEHTTSSDITIPWYNILQGLSPQVQEKTVDGAEAGMIFNTVTRELIPGDVGFVFQPCVKQTKYVEWISRDDGGGLVAMHEPNSEVAIAALKAVGGRPMGPMKLENGHDLIETVYVSGHVLNEAGSEVMGLGVMSFTSTKMKVWRGWYTAMYSIKGMGGKKKPPLFSHRARLRTFLDKNRKGQTFYNFRIDPLRETWIESMIDPNEESNLLVLGQKCKQMVESGSAMPDFEKQGGEDEEDSPAF